MNQLKENILKTFSLLDKTNLLTHQDDKYDYLDKRFFTIEKDNITVVFAKSDDKGKHKLRYDVIFKESVNSNDNLFMLILDQEKYHTDFYNPKVYISGQMIIEEKLIDSLVEAVNLKTILQDIQHKYNQPLIDLEKPISKDEIISSAINKISKLKNK